MIKFIIYGVSCTLLAILCQLYSVSYTLLAVLCQLQSVSYTLLAILCQLYSVTYTLLAVPCQGNPNKGNQTAGACNTHRIGDMIRMKFWSKTVRGQFTRGTLWNSTLHKTRHFRVWLRIGVISGWPFVRQGKSILHKIQGIFGQLSNELIASVSQKKCRTGKGMEVVMMMMMIL